MEKQFTLYRTSQWQRIVAGLFNCRTRRAEAQTMPLAAYRRFTPLSVTLARQLHDITADGSGSLWREAGIVRSQFAGLAKRP